MALLEDIKARLQQQKASLPQQGAGQAAQRLLQTKTGKAGVGQAIPKASALGEQAAAGQTQQMMQQQQLQGAMAAEQLGAQQQQQQQAYELGGQKLEQERALTEEARRQQAASTREEFAGEQARFQIRLSADEEMKTDRIASAFSNNLANLASERRISTDDIFEQFRQSNEELEFRRDAAQLEQRAFELAMSDKEYIRELQATGKLRNLENDLRFREESARLILGNQMSSLIEKLGWQKEFNKDERQFAIDMGRMDIDSAIAIANTQIQQANTQAIFSGAAAGVSSYVQNRPTSGSNTNTGADYSQVSPETSAMSSQGGMMSTSNPTNMSSRDTLGESIYGG